MTFQGNGVPMGKLIGGSGTNRGRPRLFGPLLLGSVLFTFLSHQSARAQTAKDSYQRGPDVVQEWSSEVLRGADRKLSEADRALQLMEQLRQASRDTPESDSPLSDGIPKSMLSFSTWPRAYLDVFRREAEALPSTSRAGTMSLVRLGLREDVSGLSSEPSWNKWHNRLNRMREFAPQVLQILRREGLPAELLAVPLIESGFNPYAESPKGARGLWQLMPETARRFGLNPHGPLDERLDPYRSSVAAVRYLKELYQLFGDWSLALAAYNAGEERVQQALSRSQARDFRTLDALRLLPEETRQYVPLVLAAAAQISKSRTARAHIPNELTSRK